MTEEGPLLFEVEGAVARITIDRPDRRNAVNPEVVRRLRTALDAASSDAEVRAVVLTGAGDQAFCAGADVGTMGADSRAAQHLERAEIGELFSKMRALPVPI
ncbi:MAG: enoyl-CoA hydratase/isomerase family protein, partial [Actinomycetota bacterium]